MTWFDWLAAVGLVALAVRGYTRGLILQLSAFVAVATGLLGGLYLHGPAAVLLPELGHPVLRLVAAFTVVFVLIALGVNLLFRALKTAVDALYLGFVDRLLGTVLGLLVGLQLLLLVVLFVGRYLPDGDAWLADTRTAPLLADLVELVMPLLPDHFRQYHPGNARGEPIAPFEDLRHRGERLLEEVRGS